MHITSWCQKMSSSNSESFSSKLRAAILYTDLLKPDPVLQIEEEMIQWI
jgi:hypothetical protein